jgi:dihydrofolate synthase / folylpolyglutamate synthase
VRATSEAVEEGLAQVRWPGRLEIVSRAPLVVVDGAHNGDSAQRLAAALRENFEYRRLILVLAASADKDVGGIVGGLAPDGPAVIATRSRHARAADPETLAAEARRRGLRVEIAPDISAAMERAASLAEPSDLICVTGSLFIVADARTYYGLGIGAE